MFRSLTRFHNLDEIGNYWSILAPGALRRENKKFQ